MVTILSEWINSLVNFLHGGVIYMKAIFFLGSSTLLLR